MSIGVLYPDSYAVEETFQLLKVPWEGYVPGRQYDVVIARRGDVPGFTGNLVDLSENDFFNTISSLLNTGRPHLHEPACDILIEKLREDLKRYTFLAEIPPCPWDHPYLVALTHDVDAITVKECRFRTAGYAALRCLAHGRISAGVRFILARCGIGGDPWALFNRWKELEEHLGIRSTFFFVPKKGDPGVLGHPYRAVGYDIPEDVVRDLTLHGWESGIHGIDNWTNAGAGTEEVHALGPEHKYPGNRTHWLLSDAMSFRILDEAGYSYDTTFGYNDDAGFRAGTTQVYRPRGVKNLLELPLHIQDVALFTKACFAPGPGGWVRAPCRNLSEAAARACCHRIFGYAKRYGGVVTLLWHYENLVPPRDWSGFYADLVVRAKGDGAWVTTAGDVVAWFRARRDMSLGIEVHEKRITIRINGQQKSMAFPVRVRLHLDPARITGIDAEYRSGPGYVDINPCRPEISVTLR